MTIDNVMRERSGRQPFDAFGIELQFLIPPEQNSDEISLYRATILPGLAIPLHSHREAELFYLLEGSLEVYQEAGGQQGWSTLKAGEALAIAGTVKHALRNVRSEAASVILVTGQQLYGFFHDIAKPITGPPSPPTPEDMQRLFGAAAKHSYWMGSPEENASIGISIG